VGYSYVDGVPYATEWSDGKIINLGGLPGSTGSFATGINDAGQVVGYTETQNGLFAFATEWSGGSIISLGRLPGSTDSIANGINDVGQVVGYSYVSYVPESSTWAMMLLGFAGLGFVGYRRSRKAGSIAA
jgi:probable HAF family extracellular repeat protein